MLAVEVSSAEEFARVLEILPRFSLREIARVHVSCEQELRRRVAALARREGMDLESAIIGAQPVAELEGTPGCMIGLAELDEDGGPVSDPTPLYEPHEIKLLDLDLDTE